MGIIVQGHLESPSLLSATITPISGYLLLAIKINDLSEKFQNTGNFKYIVKYSYDSIQHLFWIMLQLQKASGRMS